MKRAADNKQRYAPSKGSIPLFCCLGFSKGLAPWHTTLLAKCSVLYLLWRGWWWKRGEMLYVPRLLRQENRLNFYEWECAKNRVVFRERRQVYESPRPSSHAPTCGQNVPKCGHTPGKVAEQQATVKAEMNEFAPGLARRPPSR